MAVPSLTNNSPSAGYLAWGAFTIQYNGVGHTVASGTTIQPWVWWRYNAGASVIEAGPNVPTDLTDDDLVLFGNKAGIGVRVQAATLIDGALLVAGSIPASAIAAGGLMPTGAIIMFGSATAPVGYLSCDGSSQLRTTYPALFSAIGVAYGSVDATHFTLPNFAAAFPRGNTPAANGGSATHTHAGVDHLHSQSAHQHVITAHSHTVSGFIKMVISGGYVRNLAASGYASWTANNKGAAATSSDSTASTIATPLSDGLSDTEAAYWTDGQTGAVNTGLADRSLTTGSAGTLPPYTGVNFIIKT